MKALLIMILMLTSSIALANKQIKLTTYNTVNLRGAVSGQTVTKWMLDVKRAVVLRRSKSYPIYLVLNTPGGGIETGLAFIEFVKTIPNVHTISIYAASMGSAIVQHLPGKRYITDNGVLMFHRARGTFKGQFNNGEVEEYLKFAKKRVTIMEDRSAKRMKISLKTYRSKVVNEWWMTARDAMKQNAADAIVDIKCTVALINRKIVSTQQSIFGASRQIFSACPLFRSPIK